MKVLLKLMERPARNIDCREVSRVEWIDWTVWMMVWEWGEWIRRRRKEK